MRPFGSPIVSPVIELHNACGQPSLLHWMTRSSCGSLTGSDFNNAAFTRVKSRNSLRCRVRARR